MRPVQLADETRRPGQPTDWDEATMGVCEALSIHDHEDPNGYNQMISAWKPSELELETLNRGGFVYLHIYGLQHPVVQLHVPEQFTEHASS